MHTDIHTPFNTVSLKLYLPVGRSAIAYFFFIDEVNLEYLSSFQPLAPQAEGKKKKLSYAQYRILP